MKGSKNHNVIRHAYENVLTACARLSAYATAKPTDSIDGLINERQTILAVDDLMIFAVNARRLMGIALSLGRSTSTSIRLVHDGVIAVKPVTRIVNIIIHHTELSIVRFNYEVGPAMDSAEFDESLLLHVNVRSFSPGVRVESDKGRIMFELSNLIHTFEKEVLVPVVDACADDGLYLQELT